MLASWKYACVSRVVCHKPVFFTDSTDRIRLCGCFAQRTLRLEFQRNADDIVNGRNRNHFSFGIHRTRVHQQTKHPQSVFDPPGHSGPRGNSCFRLQFLSVALSPLRLWFGSGRPAENILECLFQAGRGESVPPSCSLGRASRRRSRRRRRCRCLGVLMRCRRLRRRKIQLPCSRSSRERLCDRCPNGRFWE